MPAYDLVLRNGRVIDGTGAPARSADVAIDGDRIAAVGDIPAGAGTRDIDVEGRAVAPGFIDVHTHDDRALIATPDMAMKVSQGVTTVVTGNCGVGRANFGRSRETLPKIAEAMIHQPIGLDAYPYAASSTVLDPQWVRESTRVLVTWSEPAPEMAGRDLAEIAAEWGVDVPTAAARLCPAGAVYFAMDEADVRRILAFQHTMIGSDGLPHDSHPHPRLWGSFPRVLGHYAREEGLFPMEEAVRRMTGLPAKRFGLANRGVIHAGAYADVTVFDPETVIDRATFAEPKQPAAGIELVMVNGEIVWQDGASTGARPGRALRRQQMQAEAAGRV